MIWTIDLTVFVLLTSLTASVFLLFWYWIGGILERIGYQNLRYHVLRFVLILFLVPVLPCLLLVLAAGNADWDAGLLFLQTPVIRICSVVFTVIWIPGVLILGFIMVRNLILHRKSYGTLVKCELSYQEQFSKVCRELGIRPGRVQLRESYRIKVAEFTGFWKPMVVIPAKKFTEEERQVIFVHELTHYKQQDLPALCLVSLVTVLHFFNPTVWWLYLRIQRYSEHACDCLSYEKAGGFKKYFGIITKLLEEAGTKDKNSFFRISLAERRGHLQERVEYMKWYRERKERSKRAVAMLGVLFLAVNTVSVYAAGKGFFQFYKFAVEETAIMVEEAPQVYDELEEYTMDASEWDGPIEIGEVDQYRRSSATFYWTVGAGKMKTTPAFQAKSGGSIIVSVGITPTNQYVNVGIIEPDGQWRYIREKGDNISHKFSLTKNGSYQVFVQNKNSVSITADGSYRVN